MAEADTAGSDWEYEYDETETETFYMTVDLSSYSNRAKIAGNTIKKGAKAAGTGNKVARSGIAEPNGPTVDPLLGERFEDQDPGASKGDGRMDEDIDETNDQSPTHPSSIKDPLSGTSPLASTEDTLQILDLHTTNPLIAHKSQLYSCTWSSTVGTDFFFAKPTSSSSAADSPDSAGDLDLDPEEEAEDDEDEGEEEDDQADTNQDRSENKPLRALPGVDLLATSRIRLTARPVNTMPAKSRPTVTAFPPAALLSTVAPPAASARQPDTVGTSSDNHARPQRPLSPVQIPLEPSASVSRQNQAAFLGRLMDIKRAKGETDDVTVTLGITADGVSQRKGLAEIAKTRGSSGRGRGRGGGRPRALSRAGGRGRGRGRGEDRGAHQDAGIAQGNVAELNSGWRALQNGTGQVGHIAHGRGVFGQDGGYSGPPGSQPVNGQQAAGQYFGGQTGAQALLPSQAGDERETADVEMVDE